MMVKAAAWIANPDNWIRVAYVAGGAAVVGIGLVMVLESTGPGRATAKVATGVAGKVITK